MIHTPEGSMPTTAQDFYAEAVQALSPTERLRLAALLLNGLTRPGAAVVDTDPVWGREDEADVTVFALRYAETLYPEEEDLV